MGNDPTLLLRKLKLPKVKQQQNNLLQSNLGLLAQNVSQRLLYLSL